MVVAWLAEVGSVQRSSWLGTNDLRPQIAGAMSTLNRKTIMWKSPFEASANVAVQLKSAINCDSHFEPSPVQVFKPVTLWPREKLERNA
jgi:hypothetical protein